MHTRGVNLIQKAPSVNDWNHLHSGTGKKLTVVGLGSKISLYSQQKFRDAVDNQWLLITL
jgi:hypothetical protein